MKDLEERGVIETQDNGSVVIKERLPTTTEPGPRGHATTAMRACVTVWTRWRAASATIPAMSFPLGSLRGDGAPQRTAGAGGVRQPSRAALAPAAALSAAPARWPGCWRAGAADAQRGRHRPSPPRAPAAPLHNKAGLLGAWLSDLRAVPVRLFGLVAGAGGGCAPGCAALAAAAAWRSDARRRRRRAGCSGPGWRCCWRPAARSNGPACTAGSRCCRATPAACWATRSGRCRCAGWASPARACCGSRCWCRAGAGAALLVAAAGRAHRRAARRAARAPRTTSASRRGPAHRREGRARARARGRESAPRASNEHAAAGDRAAGGRGAQVASASPRSGRSRCSPSSPTPSCRRSTCSTPRRPRQETRHARVARDDLAG